MRRLLSLLLGIFIIFSSLSAQNYGNRKPGVTEEGKEIIGLWQMRQDFVLYKSDGTFIRRIWSDYSDKWNVFIGEYFYNGEILIEWTTDSTKGRTSIMVRSLSIKEGDIMIFSSQFEDGYNGLKIGSEYEDN